MNNFIEVWKLLSNDFDMSKCKYQNINGRIFIHLPNVYDSYPVRIKITRDAQKNKNLLYENLNHVIVNWLSNTCSVQEDNYYVHYRLNPNKIYYCVIDDDDINCVIYDDVYVIDCINDPDKIVDYDEDWNKLWDDTDEPDSYIINKNNIKIYKWTNNWQKTFEDDFED